MIKTILFTFSTFIFICLVHAQEKAAIMEQDQCIVCHVENEIMPEHFSENDIHLQQGLSCAGCHGGKPETDDEDEAMSVSAGFVGVPDKDDIPAFCGKCHSDITFMRQFQPRIATDQVDQYFTSVHGQKLKKGDDKVADCSSCHSSHSILPAKDTRSTVHPLNVPATCKHCHSDSEYMQGYGISTGQFDDFAQSVHGIALLEHKDTGAPACNDCHGNHGATPPGIKSVSHVCGTCHINNINYFSQTTMAQKFDEQNIHGCEECHGNHKVLKTSDTMVGTAENSVCMHCHEPGDDGYKNAHTIYTMLSGLQSELDSVSIKRKVVESIGMDDVDINFLLQEANQNMIKARTLVHTFDSTKVAEQTLEGMAKLKTAGAIAVKQIDDHKTRRLGFAVASIFITILVIALFFKIREMERTG